jgi:HPr kinase/phosphorylase
MATAAPSGEHAEKAQTLHASCVALGDRAVLILGPAGSGKSTLALMLMAHGAGLVADDRTELRSVSGRLRARAPDTIRGKIEARGMGILAAAPVIRGRGRAGRRPRTPRDRTPAVAPPSHRAWGQEIDLLHKVESPAFPAAVLQYLRCGRLEPAT